MTNVTLPGSGPGHINTDALLDLCAAVVALAVHDARRGPGRQAKTRSRYDSAVRFLARIGALEHVAELHGIDVHTPRQQSLLDH